MPRSLWKIVPAAGRRDCTAGFSALITNCVLRQRLIAQPKMRRRVLVHDHCEIQPDGPHFQVGHVAQPHPVGSVGQLLQAAVGDVREEGMMTRLGRYSRAMRARISYDDLKDSFVHLREGYGSFRAWHDGQREDTAVDAEMALRAFGQITGVHSNGRTDDVPEHLQLLYYTLCIEQLSPVPQIERPRIASNPEGTQTRLAAPSSRS